MSKAVKKKVATPVAATETKIQARPPLPPWLMAALLALATFALYWQAIFHDFVNYDDSVYVTSNAHVQNGLTLGNLKWAFVTPVCANWHPITILSHMADCQLFGLKPAGHHVTNVLLHALNTVLVFLLLRSLTGAFWRSALVAVLFGWHPLHVESVAWVAERKDVLSTFFGLLALIFYTRYARHRPNNFRQSTFNYLLALCWFALGLMSKPMLVTWPFVMLLLDFWPLERFKNFRSSLSLVIEKIPFFILTVAASSITFLVQQKTGAVAGLDFVSFSARTGNALISYCRYLGKIFWPTNLAVYYPHPGFWPLALVSLAGATLVSITLFLLILRRRYPFALIGWLWFLGTLVPVIGLVQVGGQALADRYTYIPSLGIFILIIWGVSALTRRWQQQVALLSATGSMAVILCGGLTRLQLEHWRDSETLARHALAVTKSNHVALVNLGTAILDKGQANESIRYYEEAVRLSPNFSDAHYNLGFAYFKQGRLAEAIREYRETIRLAPNDAKAYNNLGNALLGQGQTAEAFRQFQEAIRLSPDFADAYTSFGVALANQGQTAEAIQQYEDAIRLTPNNAKAHSNLGNALMKQGQVAEAIRHLQEAASLSPDDADIHYNLGSSLFNQGQTDEAIRQFQETIRLNAGHAKAYNNLGVAFLQKGQPDEAIRQFREAVRLKPDYARAFNNLGNALLNQGQVAEAITALQEAVRLSPNDGDAQASLTKAMEIQAR